eukprot:5444271-Pleurochrysis_carterae.AAC.4
MLVQAWHRSLLLSACLSLSSYFRGSGADVAEAQRGESGEAQAPSLLPCRLILTSGTASTGSIPSPAHAFVAACL